MLKIAVFGATGHAGRWVTRLLLENGSTEVTACARRASKLDDLKASLADARALRMEAVDLRSDAEVEHIVSRSDLVVGATSRWSEGARLASLALGSSTSYFGLYLSAVEKWRRLRGLQDECVEKGVMLVDDGGAHPGLPAAMIRWVAEDTKLSSAWVGAKFGLNWNELDLSPETVDDFVSEIASTDPSILLDGNWVRGYRHGRKFDFGGDDSGTETCVPMCLEEIRELGSSGTIASLGFFIAGFGPLVDYGIFPLSMGLARVSRRLASGIMWRGLKWFASTSSNAVLVLEAERASDGESIRLRVSHADPYYLTAVSAVAAIRQMVTEPRPGVWTQAGFVSPASYFESLQAMGIQVDRSA